ncbi:MAG: alcohol dehydrogenase catalytic domain-containing protein [Candidatus Bathyarchaeia archaeon]
MKAQLCTRIDQIENHPLTFTTVETPKPSPDQVLIRIRACGVCHSNLHMVEGEFRDFGVPTKLPIIPGHEITGEIEETGSLTKSFQRGDRVGVQPLWGADGTCEFCLTGREHLCVNKQITGETVDGGYAEYIVVPAGYVYHMPENLKFAEAAPLFCPGVTAYRAVKRANVRFGQRVVVIGIGGVGHMAVQFAKLAGAETIAVARSEAKLKLAEELGADHAIAADKLEDYLAKTGKPDAVVVFAPSQNAIDQALRIVKRGGTVLMGVLGTERVIFPEEYSVVGSVIGSRQDMNETLRLAAMGKVKVETTNYPLSEATDVLLKLKQGKIVGRAVLLT